LELLNLSDLPVSIFIVTLSYTGQLAHTAALQDLIVVLGIHELDGSMECLFNQIS
jgi:hypothetical protein